MPGNSAGHRRLFWVTGPAILRSISSLGQRSHRLESAHDGDPVARCGLPLVEVLTTHIAAVDKVTPHILRHTYITNLLLRGVDIKTVQYLAGHERAKITLDIYAHLTYNRPEEIIEKINMAFAPQTAEY